MKKVVNVAELAEPGWSFVEEHYQGEPVQFSYHSSRPLNWIERRVTRPRLGRYRACLHATQELIKARDVVISHLPRTSHWQSRFLKGMGKKNRHLAFSFNFTDLPTGRERLSMASSFSRIDRFIVYSEFEKELYSRHFDLDEEKFEMLRWASGEVPLSPVSGDLLAGDFFCAVGGEGRDYSTLIDAFRAMPERRLVIVTRPHALGQQVLPENVSVLFDLPSGQFWSVVEASRAVLVPLRDENTVCGHITLVGAMTLGKPIISSFSRGTVDYVEDEVSGLVTAPRDVTALRMAVERLVDEPELANRCSTRNREFAKEQCHVRHWAQSVARFVEAS